LLLTPARTDSTIAALAVLSNPIDEFKTEYRCIASDLRNANAASPQSARDRSAVGCLHATIGVMDHLSIDKSWLASASADPSSGISAARAQSDRRRRPGAAERIASGNRDLFYDTNIKGGTGPREAPAEITIEMATSF